MKPNGNRFENTARNRHIGIFLVLVCVLSMIAMPSTGESRLSSKYVPSRTNYFNTVFHADQFNMCGSSCAGTRTADPVDLVVFNAASHQVSSLSLNEACHDQIDQVSQRLGLGAYVFYAKTSASGCPGTDKRFGNAILTIGTIQGALPWTFPTQSPPANPCIPSATRECRGLVCVSTTTAFTGPWTACSAHLYDLRDSTTRSQASEYIVYGVSTYPGRGLWLAGDFNLVPINVPGAYAQQFFQAPQSNTHTATSHTEIIDYIWNDRAHTASDAQIPSSCAPAYSDHCFAWVNIT
jgi:endonuclease/exonuclease/phosphatase family metal-dependent hydrolase